MPAYLFIWDFIALDESDAAAPATDSAHAAAIIEDYDAGLGELLAALTDRGLADTTNIVFTLDHGKVDTHNQAALGLTAASGPRARRRPTASSLRSLPRRAQPTASIRKATPSSTKTATLSSTRASTARGPRRAPPRRRRWRTAWSPSSKVGPRRRRHPRTMTADGYLGTRRFHDFRANSPNQADVIVFPKDDWTLNQVDATNTVPGPFQQYAGAYARHGGFSADELYVPLILAGPAFKQGVLLPHPVEHADVAPTALAAFGIRNWRWRPPLVVPFMPPWPAIRARRSRFRARRPGLATSCWRPADLGPPSQRGILCRPRS